MAGCGVWDCDVHADTTIKPKVSSQPQADKRSHRSNRRVRLSKDCRCKSRFSTARPLSLYGLLDYRGWPRRRPHSPRAERMTEKSAVTPSAMSVQTKKKPPLELAMPLATPTPFPFM